MGREAAGALVAHKRLMAAEGVFAIKQTFVPKAR